MAEEQQQQQQQQQEPQLLKDNIWVAIRKAIIGFFKAFKAMSQLNEKIDKLQKTIDALSGDMTHMKAGLQSELFDTFTCLYESIMAKGWANEHDRAKAAKLHSEIQALGNVEPALESQINSYCRDINDTPMSLIDYMKQTSTSHVVK